MFQTFKVVSEEADTTVMVKCTRESESFFSQESMEKKRKVKILTVVVVVAQHNVIDPISVLLKRKLHSGVLQKKRKKKKRKRTRKRKRKSALNKNYHKSQNKNHGKKEQVILFTIP